jgi:hypothetical protein
MGTKPTIIVTPEGRELEVIKTRDLIPGEGESIRQMARDADDAGGYLHIEIRRRLPSLDDEKDSRFWIVAVTNPDISEAAGTPVVGLVDEEAGGVVAYVLGPEDRAQALADVLNAALIARAGDIGKHMRSYTEAVR